MPRWRTALWTGALRTDTTGMPLGALYGKVPTRVRNLLVNAGYKNVTAVRRALKKGELDALPRLGKNGRDALETALADLAAGREPAQPDIYIVTYATARRDALADGKGPLLKVKPRAVGRGRGALDRQPGREADQACSGSLARPVLCRTVRHRDPHRRPGPVATAGHGIRELARR